MGTHRVLGESLEEFYLSETECFLMLPERCNVFAPPLSKGLCINGIIPAHSEKKCDVIVEGGSKWKKNSNDPLF